MQETFVVTRQEQVPVWLSGEREILGHSDTGMAKTGNKNMTTQSKKTKLSPRGHAVH